MAFDGSTEGRRLFGGSPADVAESNSGQRVPGAVGNVFVANDSTPVTDLKDLDGVAITQLLADANGFVKHYWGPVDGSDALDVDFGAGVLTMYSVDAGARITTHEMNGDPHGDRAYTDLQAADLRDLINAIQPTTNPWNYQMTDGAEYGMVVTGVPSSLAQIFQVRDPFGAPIFSVGHVGGPAAYGDNMSVYDGSFNLMGQLGLNGNLTLAGGRVLTPGDIDNLHAEGPLPSDQSFLAWSGDPAVANVSNTPVAGTVYLTKVVLRKSATINNIGYSIATNGVGVTNGFLGLYNAAGTRVGVTASQTFAPAFLGYSPAALVTPYVAAPGVYYVALVVGAATTLPVFMGMGSGVSQVNLANANTVAASNRYAINGTGKTALATTITPSANNVPQTAPTALMLWVSLS